MYINLNAIRIKKKIKKNKKIKEKNWKKIKTTTYP